jgi:hypothetical protein
MKIFFRYTLALTFFAVIFSSCGKKNEIGKMIPADALFVAHVNTGSMSQKLSWDDIKQTSWFKKTFADSATGEWRKKILDNPSSSGIDFDKGLIFFSKKATNGNYYFVAEGIVKNEDAFAQFNKNFDPSQAIQKQGDVNLLTLKDKNVVGWKGNHFIYVMNAETTHSEMYSFKDSTNSGSMIPANNSAELAVFCSKLFSLNADSSLEKNEIFGDLISQKGDIHIWQNTEEIVKSQPSMGMMGMLKLDAFLKDNSSTYTINFEDGKINVSQKVYVSKELTGVLKKYLDGKINTGMIKSIPSQNVLAVFSVNFKPQGLVELIKLTGADGIVNTYAQQLGFTLDDFAKAGNGEVLFAITDLKMTSDSFNYKDDLGNNLGAGKFNKPDFNYVFSTGISDKASLQKLINAVGKLTSQIGKDSLLNYNMNDKMFVMSNTTTFGKQYLAGGNNNYDFTDKISGHPIGLYIDFQKIFTQLPANNDSTTSGDSFMQQNLKTWKNFYLTGGDYNGSAFTSTADINMMDANTNSLKQLNAYLNEMYQIKESRRSQNTHLQKLDSLLTPPPIDTVNAK